MGALGLECRGRRPQGKGCLLLAVAGATSLVTLLLAVPITALAVLALVPQEQGGLVSGCHKSSKGRILLMLTHLWLCLLPPPAQLAWLSPSGDVFSVSLLVLFPRSCDAVVP